MYVDAVREVLLGNVIDLECMLFDEIILLILGLGGTEFIV